MTEPRTKAAMYEMFGFAGLMVAAAVSLGVYFARRERRG